MNRALLAILAIISVIALVVGLIAIDKTAFFGEDIDKYQTLITGVMAIISAIITVLAIWKQIDSGERHAADDNERAETAALIKVRKGSEDWRRYLNENRTAIDMQLNYCRTNNGTSDVINDLSNVWDRHPRIFRVVTHLQRPLQVDTQIAMMEFQTASEQLERRFKEFQDPENVHIQTEIRSARIAQAWDQMEQALTRLESSYQADLRRLRPDHAWNFLQPVSREPTQQDE